MLLPTASFASNGGFGDFGGCDGGVEESGGSVLITR